MRSGNGARNLFVLVTLLTLMAYPASADIQTDSAMRADVPGMEQRLIGFTERLQLAYSLASVAGYSLTTTDVRLRTQQLINLLEGSGGRHTTIMKPPFTEYVGLLEETSRLIAFLETHLVSSEVRRAAHASLERVRMYLEATLTAALEALGQRRLRLATERMVRAAAYLSTVLLGNPETPDWKGILYLRAVIARDGA